MKYIFSILIVLCAYTSVSAQQDPMFTKYMFNSVVFNPAYSGSQGYWDMSATFRKQWLSLDGAPTTLLVSADGNLDDNTGLGFTLYQDQIGIDTRRDFSANYAYRINTPTGKFSIGIKVGSALFQSDFQQLNIDSPDPVYTPNMNTLNPYAGVGLYYNADDFYIGASSPTLISVDINPSDSIPKFLNAHFYSHLGFKFSPSESFQLRPSLIVSIEKAAPVQANINLTAIFANRFAVGAAYRTGDSVNLNTVWWPTNRLRIGLAYDLTLSRLRTYNNGSFEVLLGYSFGESISKIQDVRNL